MKTDILSLSMFAFILISLLLLFNYEMKFPFMLNHFENPYNDNIDKINQLSPMESEELADLTIKINKENYEKYLKNKEMVEENDLILTDEEKDSRFGYSILKDTNKDSLGFCPLGSYFKDKYDISTIKNLDVFKKCKNCFKCNKDKEGWYTSGGCLGDKDSKCLHEKVIKIPHYKYVNSHSYPFLLHNQLPQHKHYYDFEQKKKTTGLNEDDWTKETINHKHNHIKIM